MMCRPICSLTDLMVCTSLEPRKNVRSQLLRICCATPGEYVVSEDELMHRLVPGTAYVTISCHMPLKGEFALYYECPEYTKFQSAAVRQTAMIDFDDARYHYDVSWLKKPRRRRGFLND